jgi:hypothetical protein
MSPKKGGRILRLEPEGIELLEACPEIMEKFIQGEWFKFCCAFQGHHEEISMLFAKNFDGFQTQVGDVIIHVTEHSIATACRFPVKVKDGGRRANSLQTCAINF